MMVWGTSNMAGKSPDSSSNYGGGIFQHYGGIIVGKTMS